ncbi:MAG: hypothetical protein WCX65_06235 [bacterium]
MAGIFRWNEEETANGGIADRKLILAVSVAAALIVMFVFPVYFTSDSRSYLERAMELVGGGSHDPLFKSFIRPPGYPLMMLLTGVVGLGTFKLLILVQTLMGLLIPQMIYGIGARVNRTTAIWSAMLSAVSLIPFICMKSVMTEQVSIFLMLLGAYCFAAYLTTGKARHIYIMSLVIFLMILVRPSAKLLFVIYLGVTVMARPKAFIHIAASVFLTAACVALAMNIGNNGGKAGAAYPSLTGTALFFNVYLASQGAVQEQNGPASAELLRKTLAISKQTDAEEVFMRETLVDSMRADYFFRRFGDDKEAFVKFIAESPSRIYFKFLWDTLNKRLGPEAADKLFLRVSLETLRAHPSVGIRFMYTNLTGLTITQPMCSTYAVDPTARSVVAPPQVFSANNPILGPDYGLSGLPKNFYNELSFRMLGRFTDKIQYLFSNIWGVMFHAFRPIVFMLMCAGLPAFLRSKNRWMYLLMFLIVAYQVAITSVFNESLPRYIYHTILFELIAAVAAVDYFLEWNCKRRNGKVQR